MKILDFIGSGASTGPVLAPEPIKSKIFTVSFSLDDFEFITNHEMVGIIPGIFRRSIKNRASFTPSSKCKWYMYSHLS